MRRQKQNKGKQRQFALVLVAGLCIGLAACGGSDSEPQASEPPPTAASPPVSPPPPPAPQASAPFQNPFLANSSWPIFHGNVYSTAASLSTGPGIVERAQIIDALTDDLDDPFVSPWTLVGEAYSDGSIPVLTTPNNGVAKYLITDGGLEPVDFLALDRNVLDFDWGFLLLRRNLGVVTERRNNRYIVFGDAREGDPFSPIEIKQEIDVDPAQFGGLLAHHSLAPDGALIALTDANKLIAIDIEAGEVLADFELPRDSGASFQNSFPVDETGRIFIAAQNLTVAVDWDGITFSLVWQAEYDMRGPGCEDVPPDRPRIEEIRAVANGEPCTGTGTTPSLVGDPSEGIMVIVDGHAPQNNLVAFWRGIPPADWEALPDPNAPGLFLDRQIAGVFALPFSTPEGDGFSAQNSPAVLGNAIVSAQWAGFDPGPDAQRGVQRIDWDPVERQFNLVWVNPNILFNGVPTIVCRSPDECQTYGMGRYGLRYEYTSLDMETGDETGRLFLSFSDEVLDQGNNHSIAPDGSIVYAGRFTLIRIE